MMIEQWLSRHAATCFGLFFVFALWAFWPSYFSHPFDQPEPRFHTHGLAMTLWCAMLIGQAYLIRTNRHALHRYLGKASYVLMPAIVLATVNLVHVRLKGVRPPTDQTFHHLALMLNATVVFAVIYGLAIWFRRQPAIHARYMVCTVFPLFTPVTDRLIYAHAPWVTEYVPSIAGGPVVPVTGFALADLIVLALAVWDWRATRRCDVFPLVLGLLLMYHASVLTFHRVAPWRAFGAWFLGLPLS